MTVPVTECDARVWVGAVSPEAFVLEVVSVDGEFDLSTIVPSGTSILVTRGNGTTSTWAATISDQGADALRLTHTFVSGDLPVPDVLSVQGIMATAGGGTVRSEPILLAAVLPVALHA